MTWLDVVQFAAEWATMVAVALGSAWLAVRRER